MERRFGTFFWQQFSVDRSQLSQLPKRYESSARLATTVNVVDWNWLLNADDSGLLSLLGGSLQQLHVWRLCSPGGGEPILLAPASSPENPLELRDGSPSWSG